MPDLPGEPIESYCLGVVHLTHPGNFIPTCHPEHIAELAKPENDNDCNTSSAAAS